MSNPLIGGKSRTDIFRLKVNATSDGYDFLNALTDVVAAAPVLATDVAQQLTLIKGSDYQPQEDGTVKLSLDQYHAGEDIYAFLDKAVVPSTSVAKPEIKFENGGKYGGTSGTGDLLLIISYLQNEDDDTPTKTFTYISLGRMVATSGAQKTDSDNYIAVSIEYSSTPLLYALSVPAACFNAALVTVAAPIVLAKDAGFKRTFLTNAPPAP